MDRLKFYETLYATELKRKEELRTALTLPTGILTVLGGVIAIYLREIGSAIAAGAGTSGSTAALGVFVFLLIISFLVTVGHLLSSYHDYTYDYVPYATDLEQAYQEYVDHFDTLEEADSEFEASVLASLISAQRKNAFNNDSKSSKLHEANQTLVYCLVLALICSVPYFLRTLQREAPVQLIEIVDSEQDSAIQPPDQPIQTDATREREQPPDSADADSTR